VGAEEKSRSVGPDGKIMHAEIQIGDSRVMLNDAMGGTKSAKGFGGSPISLWIYVPDCDTLFNRAWIIDVTRDATGHPHPSIADDEFFAACRERYKVTLHRQPEGDLGARMLNAFEAALTRSRHALLMGSDCPSLTTTDLREAAGALGDGHDAVFCPAEDGGYVLLGLSQAMPALFDAMSWGTATVMEETRQRLRNLGHKQKP